MTFDLVAEYRAAAAARQTAPSAPAAGTFSGLDGAMIAEAGRALKDWATSPEGKAVIAEARGLPPEEAAECMSAAFASENIGEIIKKIIAKLPIKAVSIGLLGQVELLVGISGSIGYAIDLGDSGETRAIYAGGGIVEGVDAGGEAAVVLGLWAESTSNINGFYVGAGVDITDGAGFDAVAFASKSDDDAGDDDGGGINWKDAKMVFIGVDIGLEDGGEAEEYYFFTHTMTKYPVYQEGGTYNYMMCFDNLNCVKSKDNTDTVFLLYTVDGNSTVYQYPIWGGIKMTESKKKPNYSQWVCGNMVRFNSSVTATLHVGNFTMPAITFSTSDFNGLYSQSGSKTTKATTDVGINHIEYNLNARLVAMPG